MTDFFGRATEDPNIYRSPEFYQDYQNVYLVYAYQFTLGAAPERYRQCILGIDKLSLETKVLRDDKSKELKNVFLYKGMMIDHFVRSYDGSSLKEFVDLRHKW